MTSNNRSNSTKALSILQINVGRGTIAHEIALALANDSLIDVILVQEPYIFKDLVRKITKSHPMYEAFTPIDNWNIRPRVITYVRKGVGLNTTQLRPCSSRDLLFLQVRYRNLTPLNIINIYNAPQGAQGFGEAVDLLFTLPEPLWRSAFLAGDFNLHHTSWNPLATSSSQSEALTEWLLDHSFILTSEIGRATHNAGNVLDLAFITGSLSATTTIAEHMNATSDHKPLLTSVNWTGRGTEALKKLRVNTIDPERFEALLQHSSIHISTITDEPTIVDLDNEAAKLTHELNEAYNITARRFLGQSTGQPWWNSDCKAAVQLNREEHSVDSFYNLRNTVRKAKTAYWTAKLDNAKEINDVFKMTKWHQSVGNFRSPPMTDPQDPTALPAVSVEEKRALLVKELLTNSAVAGDIPFNSPATAVRAIDFPKITAQDIRKAILKAGNTAPGADEIPTRVLQLAWPYIEARILKLFQTCLEHGHHPACFRTAILAVIPKPNKTDRSSPRAYRPIALLSVLGKGLERLLARNISWLAISLKIVGTQQFGALPLRSAVDLTTCLTHDVEDALSKGLKASLLTMDVKGAFDAVLPGRLIRRLREQGWPDYLVRWIQSFATQRTVKIRLDGEIGPQTNIYCGLPQGSPVSPILFMLYIAPLFGFGSTQSRFGYADDIGLLAISNDLQSNCNKLQTDMQEALDWGATEGITFDPKKSELIHFTRSRKDPPPATSPQIITGTNHIKESTTPLRWLGVYYDRKLRFVGHVKSMTAKALKVASALRSLGKTTRGVPPISLQRAVTACVLKKCYYAAETWWPGRSRTTAGKKVSNQINTHIRHLERVISTGTRSILPVYCTTQTAVLYKEAHIRPPEIELNLIAQTFAARTARLDPKHPLQIRTKRILRNQRPNTRFARFILALPKAESVNPIIAPPWLVRETREDISKRIGGPQGRTKKRAAKDFTEFLNTVPTNDIQVFSDGSKSEATDGATGGGFVSYQYNIQIDRKAFSMGYNAEVFDAEATAALNGARAALAAPSAKLATDLWVFLDNLEVAMRLLTPSAGSSQSVFTEFCDVARKWPLRHRLPHTLPGAVKVRWVPGHLDVEGNEAADKAAKEGAALPAPANAACTLASLKRIAKSDAKAAAITLWNTTAPANYTELMVTHPGTPELLQLDRRALGHILAARSQHGDFAAYHERFHHTNYTRNCSCGRPKSPLHFYYCKLSTVRKFTAKQGKIHASEAIPWLLGTVPGAIKLAKWITESKYYTTICLTHSRDNYGL